MDWAGKEEDRESIKGKKRKIKKAKKTFLPEKSLHIKFKLDQ